MLRARALLAGLTLLFASAAAAQDDMSLSPASIAPLGEQPAADPCQLRLAPTPALRYRGARSRGYEGSSDRLHTELGTITVEHGGDECTYMVRIEPDGGPGRAQLHSGSNTLTFQIDHAGRDSVQAGNVVEMRGSLSRGQRQRQAGFQISLPPGQRVPAGQYVGRVIVSLFDSRDGRQDLITRQSVDVVTQVAPSVVASFGSNAGGGVHSTALDFGPLMKGQEKSLDFSVAANTPYSIDLVSQNGGKLRHEFSDNGIGYDVRVDGRLVEPAPGEETPLLKGSSSAQHSLDVLIRTDTSYALAGKYTDRLTLVIAAD
jgi:hypothetical protein